MYELLRDSAAAILFTEFSRTFLVIWSQIRLIQLVEHFEHGLLD